MKTSIFIISMIFALIIGSIPSFGQRSVRKNQIEQAFETDTIYSAIRMGANVKFTLNEQSEFKVLIDDRDVMTVLSNGNTGFGTDKPEYTVDVCGSIRASEEIVVEANEWCDYVFEDEYQLENFDERIAKINSDKHLPYIKPENEILENGMPVNETITGLLRNVEELYLYIEELENRIDELENENQSLKTEK